MTAMIVTGITSAVICPMVVLMMILGMIPPVAALMMILGMIPQMEIREMVLQTAMAILARVAATPPVETIAATPLMIWPTAIQEMMVPPTRVVMPMVRTRVERQKVTPTLIVVTKKADSCV